VTFFFQRLALVLFGLYLAVFPGSTLTVALDRVPPWGSWMGGALLMLQGAVVLCWLIGEYGRRGALAGLLVFLIAWGVEHVGVTTGFPFGRYHYTELLQPQFFGVVPLAIAGAWLMVAIGAWQLAIENKEQRTKNKEQRTTDHGPRTIRNMLLMATLVLLLDLQIETVATAINRYWVWLDHGPYYGVPTANFVAWWLMGLAIGLIISWLLPDRERRRDKQAPNLQHAERFTFYLLPFTFYLPTYLYLLSTLMFTMINLARGYMAAGLVGVTILLVAALALIPATARKLFPAQRSQRAQRD
jgi:uncharacterized membrane protein